MVKRETLNNCFILSRQVEKEKEEYMIYIYNHEKALGIVKRKRII